MSWWEALHIALSVALFALIFIEGDDEPFGVRIGSAAFVALFWLPLIIIAAIWLLGDWIDGKVKGLRK